MRLTDAQREYLDTITDAKRRAEIILARLARLLEAVSNWDEGNPDPLVPEEMTAQEVISKARSVYADLLTALEAAVAAFPTDQ